VKRQINKVCPWIQQLKELSAVSLSVLELIYRLSMIPDQW